MADWGSAATNALGGASVGFGIGGPIGGVAGGLIGGISSLFGNKKKKKKTISAFDPRQQQLNQYQFDSILGKGPLADLYNYDPEAANKVFDLNVARPAYRDLQEKAIPSVTGQFRSHGLMQSSYAGDAVGRLVRDTQENLDAKRAEYQYGEQRGARDAKRNAVENYQNRNTFAYESGEKPFDIGAIINSLSPSNIQQFKDVLAKFK